MRLILCLSILLLLFTVPAFSELTVDDLEKINSIVEKNVKEAEQRLKEDIAAVEEKVVASEQRLTENTVASEKRLTENISHEIGKVYIKMEGMDRRLTGEIKTLGDRLDHIFLLVLALVAFVGVVIGLPQLIVAMQRKEQRTLGEKIEAQQKQIEALQQAIETRDQERIVRP